MMAAAIAASAQNTTVPDSTVTVVTEEVVEIVEPVATGLASSQAAVHFAWGVEITGNVDMTRNDMSSAAFDACFGMKTIGVPILGVGVGVNVPVSNSQRSVPIFAVVRTNFSKNPTLCFLDLRGGISVNYLENDKRQTGGYFSGGLGFNLASGKTFQSYLIVGYSFYERKNYIDPEDVSVELPSLHMATIRLGITF